jgi:dipeptidase E
MQDIRKGAKNLICFLTSNPIDYVTSRLNPANGFIDELRKYIPSGAVGLFICSDPDGYERTDFFAQETEKSFNDDGFDFGRFSVLDHRNYKDARRLVNDSDLIILAGGHVPTQNRFFAEIGLRDLLRSFNGVLIGISAGTMNSAKTVYAQPELPGEVANTGYIKFLPGLDLTSAMILPHYQECKNAVLDGFRVYENVTYRDSIGRNFYAIPDGSYLFICGRTEELRREAYLIRDGAITQISSVGERITL